MRFRTKIEIPSPREKEIQAEIDEIMKTREGRLAVQTIPNSPSRMIIKEKYDKLMAEFNAIETELRWTEVECYGFVMDKGAYVGIVSTGDPDRSLDFVPIGELYPLAYPPAVQVPQPGDARSLIPGIKK